MNELRTIEPVPPSAYDFATREKIPVVAEMLSSSRPGLALDVGSGSGYMTSAAFGSRPTVCVDIHRPNLQSYRDRMAATDGGNPPLCVVALATALPFKSDTFQVVLCSEVLEHLDDDAGAARELAWALAPGGTAVITVPYSGFGFASFLELCGIKTIHDFPGPERHVRIGYSEESLARLLRQSGLHVERVAYYLRFFTRLAADVVSLGHLLYQRIVFGRRAWNWSEFASLERDPVFGVYRRIFPLLWGFSRLDRLLPRTRGFGLIATVTKNRAPSDGGLPADAKRDR